MDQLVSSPSPDRDNHQPNQHGDLPAKQDIKVHDPNGYDYDDHLKEFDALERLLELPEGQLEQLRLARGGKAVGLAVCEKLVERDERLMVPEQLNDLPLEPSEIIKLQNTFYEHDDHILGIIYRTSRPNEDWIDPRCGVGGSPKTHRFNYSVEYISQYFQEHDPEGKDHIAQPRFEGVGYVVDVAYSRVLRKPIIHISSGGCYSNRYTSATEDLNAYHVAYDLVTGECITAKHKNDSLYTEMAKVAREISRVGFDFGFQIELIIHPHKQDGEGSWKLVQFRPSPEPLRVKEEIDFSDMVEREPSYISPATSGHGRVKAEVYKPEFVVDGRMTDFETTAHDLCPPFERPNYEPKKAPEDFKKKVDGKIIFWKWLHPYHDRTIEILGGAAATGAVAQISGSAMFHAANHDGFRGFHNYQDTIIRRAKDQCLFVQIYGYKNDERLYGKEYYNTDEQVPSEMEILSDGLVAAIYKEESSE